MQDAHKKHAIDSPTSDDLGTLRKPSERDGMMPNASEPFGPVPHPSEPFRTVRNTAERSHNHTLTVREAARMFEAAGVARTERSIVKWCLPNKHDVARLDAFFDANERRWFITPESAERAIAEEKAKALRNNNPLPNPSEGVGTAPTTSDAGETIPPGSSAPWSAQVKKLEQEVLDLKILNGGKDFVIDQFRKERVDFVQQIASYSREVGRLETELRQLAGPRTDQKVKHYPPPRDGEAHPGDDGEAVDA